MQQLGYYFFRLFVFIISLIPFSFLYKIADVLYYLLYYIIGYRKKVVLANLRRSFPNKSETEIIHIAKGFYQNFTDISLEGLKGFSMSKEELLKRYKGINIELINQYYEKGQNILALGSHYANWEWGVLCSALQFKHLPVAFYKHLSNKRIDDYMRDVRANFRMQLVHTRNTTSAFETHQNKDCAFIMLTDQRPRNTNHAHWVEFLQQDTACLHGAEKYARQYDLPVVFIDIQRIKRGFYTFTLSLLTEHPKEMGEGEITTLFMKRLEQVILAQPENWLWSHKRWKQSRGVM